MKSLLPAFLALPLLIASCEEKEQRHEDNSPTQQRATKSKRSGGIEQQQAARETKLAELTRISELPTPEERDKAIAQWVWDVFETDPAMARAGFAKLTPGSEERNRLIQHYATKLAEQDEEEANRWAASLESEEDKSLAFGRIAMAISEKDPESAAQLLSDSGVAGREFDVAVVQVVQQWSSTAPETAANWVTRFNNGDSRKAGLKAVASSWMSFNPEATVKWLSSIPNETVRNEAINGYAEAVLEHPPMLRQILLQDATPEIREKYDELDARAKAAEEAAPAEEEEN